MQSQMAGQGEIGRPVLQATCNRRGLTNTALFYETSYKASYGRDNLSPHLGHRYGTGYSSNLRPVECYRVSLDHIDNPRLGVSFLDTSMSQTAKLYQPRTAPDGSEPLPNLRASTRESGHLQLKTCPKDNMLLQTEYRRCFVPHHPGPPVSQKHVTVGQKGESGFTEEKATVINTFAAKNSYTYEPRRTGCSVMKEDFLPVAFLQGTEALPSLVSHHSREMGFTRDTRAPLAWRSSLLPPPVLKTDVPTKWSIGKKECSGFILNTHNYQTTPFDHSQFLTNYQSKFCDLTAAERLRADWTGRSIQTNRTTNAYTRREMDRFIFKG